MDHTNNPIDAEWLKTVAFSEYKSIKAHKDTINIDMDSNVSLIIGRNNSGKSSLIDVIEKAFNSEMEIEVSDLSFGVKLDIQHILKGFRGIQTTGGVIIGNNAQYYIGRRLFIERKKNQFCTADYQEPEMKDAMENPKWDEVAKSFAFDLSQYRVLRINADRDIVPECETDLESVEKNGEGATNIVRKFLNYDKYDESIVEQTILRELNIIMQPDAFFSSIRIQQIDSSGDDKSMMWEIFLQEDGERFALSKCGSGLKTILLILINLYLLPNKSHHSIKKTIFAFEEVENNLHPDLQRRLFQYLYDYARREDTRVILTTHSHVAINSYYGKPGVSLYHITKNDGVSSVKKIDNDEKKLNILDDIGVKASDLFQANGIIWVEGPSDRVYIKRWLEVFGKADITEGIDYQFAYYGGRLLAHYTSNEKEEKIDGLINVLKINRHVAIVIDSDRNKKGGRINDTKIRIRDEFKTINSFCWITAGREIENYLSADAVNRVHNKTLSQIGQYDHFPDYIRSCDSSFESHKVDSARKYVEYITEENSCDVLDLKEKITILYEQIKTW